VILMFTIKQQCSNDSCGREVVVVIAGPAKHMREGEAKWHCPSCGKENRTLVALAKIGQAGVRL
jgi:predicted RNA-binding Zn-ribbon protein involved in translation (DUF1610 family)